MSTARWLVKFTASNQETFDCEAHIPVFHRWIQQRRLPLVLIDVADYAHVPDGPGVLLVSSEYNIFADRFGGKAGLTVQRKLRDGAGATSLVDTLRTGLQAITALESEPSLPGSRFDLGNVEIVVNDRLHGPNTDEGWAAMQPAVREAARSLFGESASVERTPVAAGERLAARITGSGHSAKELLARLG